MRTRSLPKRRKITVRSSFLSYPLKEKDGETMKKLLYTVLVIILALSMTFALYSCKDNEPEQPKDDEPSDVIPDDEPNDDPEDDPNKEDESVDDNTDPNPDDSKDDTTEDKDPEDDKKEEESGNENEQEKVPNYNDGGINLPFIPAT